MRPGAREAVDGFLPLVGAATDVYIAYAPVTNKEYAAFKGGFTYPAGQDDYPVVNVSYTDAVAYCDWLSVRKKALIGFQQKTNGNLLPGTCPRMPISTAASEMDLHQ